MITILATNKEIVLYLFDSCLYKHKSKALNHPINRHQLMNMNNNLFLNFKSFLPNKPNKLYTIITTKRVKN
jgi:hypothetical protein